MRHATAAACASARRFGHLVDRPRATANDLGDRTIAESCAVTNEHFGVLYVRPSVFLTQGYFQCLPTSRRLECPVHPSVITLCDASCADRSKQAAALTPGATYADDVGKRELPSARGPRSWTNSARDPGWRPWRDRPSVFTSAKRAASRSWPTQFRFRPLVHKRWRQTLGKLEGRTRGCASLRSQRHR